MHLSRPEGHAVISVKSCDRKSIALRKAHGKATALSVCSAFCSLPPSLHTDRAAGTRARVLLTLCLSSSSSEAIQGIQSVCKPGNGEGCIRQGVGLLTGSDCLAGRLQAPAHCFHPSCALSFRKPSHGTSEQLHSALHLDLCSNSKSLFHISTQGRTFWPSSSRLWSLY